MKKLIASVKSSFFSKSPALIPSLPSPPFVSVEIDPGCSIMLYFLWQELRLSEWSKHIKWIRQYTCYFNNPDKQEVYLSMAQHWSHPSVELIQKSKSERPWFNGFVGHRAWESVFDYLNQSWKLQHFTHYQVFNKSILSINARCIKISLILFASLFSP